MIKPNVSFPDHAYEDKDNFDVPCIFLVANCNNRAQQRQWDFDVTNHAPGQDLLQYQKPNEDFWLIGYSDPIIAAFIHPYYGKLANTIWWQCKGEVKYALVDKRVLCTSITSERPYNKPHIPLIDRIKFCFQCLKIIFNQDFYTEWAQDWVNKNSKAQKETTVREIVNKCLDFQAGRDGPEAQAAFAAQYACWICSNFQYANREEDRNIIENMSANVIISSATVAHRMESKHFDLRYIAEIILRE